jgi:ABC-type dipeptide/oligopeptide/nickel transport system permease component
VGVRLEDALTGDGQSSRALAAARSVGRFVATLAGAALVVQLLLALAPGDAADLVTDDPAMREALLDHWGLDKPLLERWGLFLWNGLQGDLGTSLTYRPGEEVSALVGRAAGQSLKLLLGAVLLVTAAGVALSYAGGRFTRKAVQLVSVAPAFLLAAGAVTVLNETAWEWMEAGRLDRPDWFALPLQDHPLRTALAISVLALGSSALSEVVASVSGELARIRSSPYVEAARARGAALWPHVLSNLLPPLTTVIASRTAFFLGGLVVVEKVLSINGAGAMLWQACRMRDLPLAMGITLVAAAVVAAVRLLGDIVRLGADPRLSA